MTFSNNTSVLDRISSRPVSDLSALSSSEVADLLRSMRAHNESVSRGRKHPAPVLLTAEQVAVLAPKALSEGTWMSRVRCAGLLASLVGSQDAAAALRRAAEETGADMDPNIIEQIDDSLIY